MNAARVVAGGRLAAVVGLVGMAVLGEARDRRPALLAAVAAGDGGRVAALLQAGADPDLSDPSGWTPVHEAVARGDAATLRTLLDAGADPDLRSRDRGTPLDVAERAGRGALARLLRARGARGSGTSVGDGVCVLVWAGDGYCGRVDAVEGRQLRVKLAGLRGCADGCPARVLCSQGRVVGGATGLDVGDLVRVPRSCLTHTGLERVP